MLQFLLSCAGMRSRPFILRCAAFFLILVFAQKAGAGLFLHNLLHSNIASNKIPGQENEKNRGFRYNCTCIDDFLMPFDGSEEPVYAPPVSHWIAPGTFFEDRIPFYTPILSSPRGPPFCKA
jgi:hypothetical protein